MLLADFMDASFALIMEERLRIQPMTDFISVTDDIVKPDAKVERAPSRREVKDQNADAMASLQAMMAGVQNSPLKKKRPRR